MALQKEVWKQDIIANLFKNNQFAQRCVNADNYVLGGKVVHLPVAGKATKSKKNLITFPQVATNRADTELTYVLDKYYQLPKTIENLEQAELSYDKRQSVAGEMESQLIEDSMEGLLLAWNPTQVAGSNSVLLTAGDDTSADTISGAAGVSRKTFTKQAFKDAAKYFSIAKLGNAPKVALLNSIHYYEFLESLSEGEKTAVGKVADMSTGIVGSYMGFDIYMRSSVGIYRQVNGLLVPQDFNADDYVAGDTDANGSLFYADQAVERALGEINMFDDTANPLYYGDILSMDLRAGGRIRRPEGVISVVDKVTAA